MKTLIGILIVAVFSIIFALQNVQVVQTKAFFWTFESPLVLIIVLSIVSGVVFGILFSIATFVTRKSKNNKNPEDDREAGENLEKVNRS